MQNVHPPGRRLGLALCTDDGAGTVASFLGHLKGGSGTDEDQIVLLQEKFGDWLRQQLGGSQLRRRNIH